VGVATVGLAVIMRVWYVFEVMVRWYRVEDDGWEVEEVLTGLYSFLIPALVPFVVALLIAGIGRRSRLAQIAAVIAPNLLGAFLMVVLLGSGYGSGVIAFETAGAYFVMGTAFYAVALLARHSLWSIDSTQPARERRTTS
jgi:hypothetical protein